MELLARGVAYTRGEAVVAVVLTRKSLAERPYCALRGVSCAWVGHPVQKDLLKSVIMKTYLAAHIGKRTCFGIFNHRSNIDSDFSVPVFPESKLAFLRSGSC